VVAGREVVVLPGAGVSSGVVSGWEVVVFANSGAVSGWEVAGYTGAGANSVVVSGWEVVVANCVVVSGWEVVVLPGAGVSSAGGALEEAVVVSGWEVVALPGAGASSAVVSDREVVVLPGAGGSSAVVAAWEVVVLPGAGVRSAVVAAWEFVVLPGAGVRSAVVAGREVVVLPGAGVSSGVVSGWEVVVFANSGAVSGWEVAGYTGAGANSVVVSGWEVVVANCVVVSGWEVVVLPGAGVSSGGEALEVAVVVSGRDVVAFPGAGASSVVDTVWRHFSLVLLRMWSTTSSVRFTRRSLAFSFPSRILLRIPARTSRRLAASLASTRDLASSMDRRTNWGGAMQPRTIPRECFMMPKRPAAMDATREAQPKGMRTISPQVVTEPARKAAEFETSAKTPTTSRVQATWLKWLTSSPLFGSTPGLLQVRTRLSKARPDAERYLIACPSCTRQEARRTCTWSASLGLEYGVERGSLHHCQMLEEAEATLRALDDKATMDLLQPTRRLW